MEIERFKFFLFQYLYSNYSKHSAELSLNTIARMCTHRKKEKNLALINRKKKFCTNIVKYSWSCSLSPVKLMEFFSVLDSVVVVVTSLQLHEETTID